MKIGDLRRSLFMPYNCKWNGVVRDITATQETAGEEVYEDAAYVGLIETIKTEALLDTRFPREGPSRLDELFAEMA